MNPEPNDPNAHEPSDLGFGKVVAQAVQGRFIGRDGVPMSRKYGLGNQAPERFYLAALNATWTTFVGWLLGLLLLANGVFALAYVALGSGALGGAERLGLTDPFLRAFAFSVGVFTTVGTGPVYAVGSTAAWLVIVESLLGPLLFIVAFGLIIARLTRPRMRLAFSESMAVAPYEGGRGVMFRMVNTQPGELSEVRARVTLVWYEEVDGVRERHFHALELERETVEMFTLHWTVVHPITASSPLAGVTPEKLAAARAEFVVFVAALEETFGTRVSARTSYQWDEVRWDVRFASIFTDAPEGVIAIDVERLGRTERLEENATRVPAPIESAQG